MTEISIDGLEVLKLNQIKDERGAVFHFLKSTDSAFKGFGEAYYSKINPKIVKGWKLHHKVYQHFCVPCGSIKIVIFDNRLDSLTNGNIVELILDDDKNYYLLTMPPGLWYSFKCICDYPSLLANIINTPHDKSESINLPLNNSEIPFCWD
jgi:dTDP-4-dehydrorhamnose 3,5-epimerase